MPRTPWIFPIGFALIIALPVAAQTFESLLDDTEDVEAAIETSAQLNTEIAAEAEFQAKNELFPEFGSGQILDTQTRTGAESSTHVVVRVNGVPVVLDDVPLSEWFAPYVRDMAERGVISGYKDTSGQPLGQFGPADPVTIEQLAKIAVEAAVVDQTKCPAKPLNKRAQDWSVPYISCAEYLRWTIFSDGSVDPKRPANRTEVVTTVLQAFSRPFEPATGKVFDDVSSTMPLRDAIETAAQDGIVSGYTDAQGNPTGKFGPFDNVNRAETAKMFSLALQVYGGGNLSF